MKDYNQRPKLFLALEKDEKYNKSGMQMRVWYANNKTTVIIRLFRHNRDATNKLWNKKRNNGQVTDFMLNELYVNNVIKNVDNWYYSVALSNEMQAQDEFEEKDKCIYFAWNVKENLLAF